MIYFRLIFLAVLLGQTFAASQTACGMIETTPEDPDWLVVTSDAILRSNICNPSWYDKPFNSCIPRYQRYWKLAPNSGTAYAYPLQELGVGSFDGIYVRRKVGIQFYSGVGEANPFGPALTGPKYISVDHWQDLAPEGFEPGTFLVSGGAGGLAGYSLKIGGSPLIVDIDLQEKENTKDHRTTKYKEVFEAGSTVFRRSSHASVKVKMSKDYGQLCHEVYFEFRHLSGSSSTVFEVPEYETAVPPGEWGAQILSVKTNSDGTRTVDIKLTIPENALIGEYEFSALVRSRGTSNPPSHKYVIHNPMYLLFNPWSLQDSVSMDHGDIEEYILNTDGMIWRGSVNSNSPKSWRYSQFDKDTLTVTMSLLSGEADAFYASPALVSRRLSKMANSPDDDGILRGRWDGDCGDGFLDRLFGSTSKNPSFWSGSDQIISRYADKPKPVEYGQCWVFAGLLTSLLQRLAFLRGP